jgi:predicted nucleotidyltransferase
MARGDAGPQSDIDLLIGLGAEPSAWFLVGWLPSWRNCLAAAFRWRPIQVETSGDPH